MEVILLEFLNQRLYLGVVGTGALLGGSLYDGFAGLALGVLEGYCFLIIGVVLEGGAS